MNRKMLIASLGTVLVSPLFMAASCDGANSGGSDPHPGRIVAKDHIPRGWGNEFGYDKDCPPLTKCIHPVWRLECWQLTVEYENAFGGKPTQRIHCVKHDKYRAAKVGQNYKP